MMARKEWKKCSNMKNLEIFTYREKEISMKAIGQIVNIFCELFFFNMKVFICFPPVPSSGKCFSATFPSQFFFLILTFPLHTTLPSGSEILFYSLPALHFIKCCAFSRKYSDLGERVQCYMGQAVWWITIPRSHNLLSLLLLSPLERLVRVVFPEQEKC